VALTMLRSVSHVSEGVDSVWDGVRPVRVCCLYGLGFGSDVAVVVRLDGSSE
jgi:hypothetical protein